MGKRVRDIEEAGIRYDYRDIHGLPLQGGGEINHKRGLQTLLERGAQNLRQKKKNRQKSACRVPKTEMPSTLNERWAMDFVSDRLYNRK